MRSSHGVVSSVLAYSGQEGSTSSERVMNSPVSRFGGAASREWARDVCVSKFVFQGGMRCTLCDCLGGARKLASRHY